MKVEELAQLMGITKEELEAQLNSQDVVELKLTERQRKTNMEQGQITIMQ